MSILNKKKNTSEKVEAIELDLQGMSYTQYITKEREAERERIKEIISKLEEQHKELLDEYNSREEIIEARKRHKEENERSRERTPFNITDPKIVKVFEAINSMRERLEKVDFKYPIDSELLMSAREVDIADINNKAADMINSIVSKTERILPDIYEVQKLLIENGQSVPLGFYQFASVIVRAVENFNVNQSALVTATRKINKEEAIEKFIKRKKEVDKEKELKEEEDKVEKAIKELLGQ